MDGSPVSAEEWRLSIQKMTNHRESFWLALHSFPIIQQERISAFERIVEQSISPMRWIHTTHERAPECLRQVSEALPTLRALHQEAQTTSTLYARHLLAGHLNRFPMIPEDALLRSSAISHEWALLQELEAAPASAKKNGEWLKTLRAALGHDSKETNRLVSAMNSEKKQYTDIRNDLAERNDGLARNLQGYMKTPSGRLNDYRQVARLGILKAIERFEPALGFRFSTYALFYIRKALQDETTPPGEVIRVAYPFSAVAHRVKHYLAQPGARSDVEEVARTFGVSPEIASSLCTIAQEFMEASEAIPDHRDTDPDSPLLAAERKRVLKTFLEKLTPRELHILESHYGFNGEPLSMRELSRRYGLSHGRVRQIKDKIFENLRKRLEPRIGD